MKKLGVVLMVLAAASVSAEASGASGRWFRGLEARVGGGGGSTERSVREYIRAHAKRLTLDGVELGSDARLIEWRGHKVFRIGQTLEGLPVFGRVVIARVDSIGRLRTVVTNAVEGMGELDESPRISSEEAIQIASRAWDVPRLGFLRVELGVYAPRRGSHRLVWRVDGAVGLRANRTYVDAHTGKWVRGFWRTKSGVGNVYSQNPVTTPEPEAMEIAYLTQDATTLSGEYVTVYRHAGGAFGQAQSLSELDLEQTATADASGDFLYDPAVAEPDYADPFAEVSVYYHLNRIYEYFRDTHGYQATQYHIGIANYSQYNGTEPQPYDNAGFSPIDGDYVFLLGQGSQIDLGYDGDVIYHEFGHGVVDNVSNLGLSFSNADALGTNTGPGGIHEGMADYWAGSLTHDPVIGEFALESLRPGASRNMENDRVCPDDIWGESHEDGRLLGAAAWDVRTIMADPVLSDSLLFGVLATLVTDSTYRDFAVAVLDSADAMVTDGDMDQATRDELETALTSRNMLECDRSIALQTGERQTGIATNFQMIAQMISMYSGQQISCEESREYSVPMLGGPVPPFPGNFQFSQEVASDISSVSFRIQHEPDNGLHYWVYVRKGEMVGFDVQGGYFTFAVAADYDYEFGPLETGDETITIDLDSDPPLEPGQTYYVALAQKNCTINTAGITGMDTTTRISATVEQEVEIDGGVPVDGGDPDGGDTQDASAPEANGPKTGGCDCSQPGGPGGPGGPASVLLFLALLAGLWLRRSCLGKDTSL